MNRSFSIVRRPFSPNRWNRRVYKSIIEQICKLFTGISKVQKAALESVSRRGFPHGFILSVIITIRVFGIIS